MATILVNGVRTHYQWMPARRASPEGAPVVVCVHGIGYDSLASFYLTLAAPLAEAGIDVLAYDLRGHGRSARPATGYRLGDFVGDLEDLIGRLHLDRPVHLLGNSFGGTVAFSFAARHPERVASVVSIESEPATEAWSAKMSTTIRNVVDAMADETSLSWVAGTFGAHYARLTKAAGAIIRSTSIVEEIAAGPLLSADDLDAIRCPVLSIVGSEGFQQDDLTAVAASLPHCHTNVIDGQGHSVLVERHQTVRRILLGWLAEHDPVDLPGGAGLAEDGAA
ncbi:alpha/beta fold hydrolase [Amycolatopsis sp. CA-126428]|uniref:alpha/beta fold hydrolase n=1 Tax=Amycolatopsis sp. CA-126428 TaxID=2073158 RepID=UPI000CD2D04F|nr:alpha/beta hydrolase [Amycolatopsis sp. CA-126428]